MVRGVAYGVVRLEGSGWRGPCLPHGHTATAEMGVRCAETGVILYERFL